MTGPAADRPEANLKSGVKKVGLSGKEFFLMVIQELRSSAWSACTTGFLQGNIRD